SVPAPLWPRLLADRDLREKLCQACNGLAAVSDSLGEAIVDVGAALEQLKSDRLDIPLASCGDVAEHAAAVLSRRLASAAAAAGRSERRRLAPEIAARMNDLRELGDEQSKAAVDLAERSVARHSQRESVLNMARTTGKVARIVLPLVATLVLGWM